MHVQGHQPALTISPGLCLGQSTPVLTKMCLLSRFVGACGQGIPPRGDKLWGENNP